jgi:branched-chain amino acid transport system substrate-binding protein
MKFARMLTAASTLLGIALAAPALAQGIKIGFNAPLTGFAAADGASSRAGAELAVQEINAAGGVAGRKLELVVYDDAASPKDAVPIAKKMIEQDKVTVGVSGSYSAPTRAAASVFQSAGIPYVTAYAVHPDITRAGNFNFRTFTVGVVEGKAAAKLMAENLGKKRAVVVSVNNDFGQSLAQGFVEAAPKLGIQIINRYEFAMPDRQFGPIVAKIKSDNPDAIYIAGYFFHASLVAQLRQAGVTAPIIGTAGFDNEKFLQIAGPASEGVIFTTSLDRDSKAPETQQFIQGIEKKTNAAADMVAASAYSAIVVVASALKKAGTEDPKAIRDAIAATQMRTAIGDVRFNKMGELVKDVEVQVVKQGKFRHYTKLSDPVLLAPPEQ